MSSETPLCKKNTSVLQSELINLIQNARVSLTQQNKEETERTVCLQLIN